tara:strand:- start:884 stop:1240 length:357 start_codon:yes stop_codon:yes gene_type:complete
MESGVSPEDIEARFYVRWLTKTKKEIYHYTNQGLLSTSCAWDASGPGMDATTNLVLIGNGVMEVNGDPWTSRDWELARYPAAPEAGAKYHVWNPTMEACQQWMWDHGQWPLDITGQTL